MIIIIIIIVIIIIIIIFIQISSKNATIVKKEMLKILREKFDTHKKAHYKCTLYFKFWVL